MKDSHDVGKTYASNELHRAHPVYELFHTVVSLESILHWRYISDAKNGLIGVLKSYPFGAKELVDSKTSDCFKSRSYTKWYRSR